MSANTNFSPPRFGADITFGGYPPQPSSFIGLNEVVRRTAMSKSTIYQRMSENRFPQSVKLGDRMARWHEQEIEAWIQRKIDASRIKSA